MRILLIEDDPDLGELLLMGLRNAAYATDHVPTIAEAEELLTVTEYDVAYVDLGLPDGDGLDLVRRLAQGAYLQRPRRVLIATARDAVSQRVAGLDAGADDYLVKPFAFEELMARVRALSRRDEQTSTVLEVGDVRLDVVAQVVTRSSGEVSLTAREFALLRYLMSYPNQTLSAEKILEHVWDRNVDPLTTSVRVIMSRLRNKLGEPALIRTVAGAGYRIEGSHDDSITDHGDGGGTGG